MTFQEVKPDEAGLAPAEAEFEQPPRIVDEYQLAAIEGESKDSGRLRFLRKSLGILALSAAAFLGGGTAGSMATPAHTKLGPHKAEMYLTMDSRRTIDFGLPGSLSWPMKIGGHGAGVGIRLDIKGIPLDTKDRPGAKSGFSEQDLHQYESFFSDPTKDRQQIVEDGRRHFVSWGIGSMAVFDTALLGVYLGSRYALDKNLRRQIADSVHAKRRGLRTAAASTAIMLAAAGVGAAIRNGGHAESDTVGVNADFADTPLAGAQVRGKLLADGLNKYGVEAMRFLEENRRFYQTASDNLKQEFTDASEVLRADSKHNLFLFETGLHCNIGMTRVIGQAVKLYKPSFVLDGGDITFSGSALEAACLDNLRDQSRGRPLITAPGNHDSDTTIQQAGKSGLKVLSGEVLEVGGLRILGDSDPRYSAFGQAVTSRADRRESVRQMGERLAVKAADDPKGVDILLVNEPNAVKSSTGISGAKLALSGGFVQDITLYTRPDGSKLVSYVGASAGGASPNRMTIGPLEGSTAQVTIFKFDENDRQPVAYQIITVNPDATVDIASPVWLEPSATYGADTAAGVK